MLPQAGLEAFKQQWLMPAQLDYSHTARLYELEHQRIELQNQFLPVLEKALQSKGITLSEVMLNWEKIRMRQIRYFEMIDNYFSLYLDVIPVLIQPLLAIPECNVTTGSIQSNRLNRLINFSSKTNFLT